MTKNNTDQVAKKTPDVTQEQMEKLREIFPEVFTEGKVDFDKLKETLGDSIDDRPERYLFTWAGRGDAVKAYKTPAVGTLIPARDESINFDETDNLFIEGDNLEVLKLLRKAYFGQVKMIYIDPPYNTGGDFVYPDNFRDPLDTYLKISGQKDSEGSLLTSNRDSSGRYHSSWLTMMYPRIVLARQLLKDDGVVFVSIDDNEVKNLRMLMDSIFGEENFFAQIPWQSRTSVQNDTDLSIQHEYLVAYARVRRKEQRRLKESNADVWYKLQSFAAYPLPLVKSRYSNPDDDPRGDWKADPFDAPNIRENLTYPIENPNTGEKHLPPQGRCWRMEESRYLELLKDNRIVFGRSGDGRPQLKVFYEDKKDFGEVPTSWFDGENYGTSTLGTQELQKLFDNSSPFSFPKPTSLVKALLCLATRDGDIVLDFFAGSSTTAHAVLQQNNEDGENRRFIMVQLPEPTPENSPAKKAGYETIAEIGKERIRRVIAKMDEEGEPGENEDRGFKVFKLAPSNYKQWDGSPEQDPKSYVDQIEMFSTALVDGWKPENVIYEVAIKEGYPLTSKLEVVEDVDSNHVYKVSAGDMSFHICLDDKLSDETVERLGLNKESLFVCLDAALSDDQAANIALQCKLKTI